MDRMRIQMLSLDAARKYPKRDGLYLVERHAELIARGKKTLVLKAKRFDVGGKKLYLITEDRILGEIELSDPVLLEPEEIEERRREHQVTEEEQKTWWPEHRKLWAYEVKSFKRIQPPLAYNRKPGVQTFQKDVQPLARLRESREGRKVEFNLLHRSWQGPIVIRAGRRGHDWIVMYPEPDRSRGYVAFHLNDSPLKAEKVPAVKEMVDDEFFNFEGQIPPEHPVNPLKRLPMDQEILDRGEAIILENLSDFVKIIFKGKRLKGTWAFQSINGMWQMERSAGPGSPR